MACRASGQGNSRGSSSTNSTHSIFLFSKFHIFVDPRLFVFRMLTRVVLLTRPVMRKTTTMTCTGRSEEERRETSKCSCVGF